MTEFLNYVRKNPRRSLEHLIEREESIEERKVRVLSYIIQCKKDYDGLTMDYRQMSKDLNLSIGKLQRAIDDLLADGEIKQGPRRGLMVKPFNGWSPPSGR